MAAADPKFYPTTSGVSLRDLGAAVVPLARNVASIQVPGLRARSPVFASWTVTLACNLGCAHCSFNRPLPDELPHAERLEVAHRLARSTAWGVSLIGGEPLLVKELFEYARILKQGGKRVFLGTSGDRLGQFIDEILSVLKAMTVTVVVDGIVSKPVPAIGVSSTHSTILPPAATAMLRACRCAARSTASISAISMC